MLLTRAQEVLSYLICKKAQLFWALFSTANPTQPMVVRFNRKKEQSANNNSINTMKRSHAATEAFLPSGLKSEKLSLPSLQSKMKCDPEGYESELLLIRSQFNSSLELFQQQSAMNFTSISGISNDPTVAKDLADKAMFLSHLTSFYPQHLSQFPNQLAELLRCAARTLPSGLRNDLANSLILLVNREVCVFRCLVCYVIGNGNLCLV